MADGNMIEIEYLNISFGRSSRTNHAVKGIDLPVKKGECFGLVGESGCGKSTLLGAIAGRLKDWRGSITIAGDQLGRKKRNHDQLRRQQMVFQDPFGSLHPRHTIGGILMEPLVIHGIADHEERVEKALDQVGLLPRNEFLRLLQVKGADLIQPDICVVGGISEMRRIAALAEAYFVGVAPHNPMGPLATAVNVHFAAAQQNFKILEYRLPTGQCYIYGGTEVESREDSTRYVVDPYLPKDGYLELRPDRPGWGVEMDVKAMEEDGYVH